MKAFRAYFDFDDVLAEEEGGPQMVLSIVPGNPNTTGIENKDFNLIKSGRTYSISGQYVGDAKQMAKFPKGVYIVDGKKVVK